MDPVSVVEAGIAAVTATEAAAATVPATVALTSEAAQVGTAVVKSAEVVGNIGETVQTAGEVVKAAEILPNPLAAEKVAGLARAAEAATDPLAGQQAIVELTQMPDSIVQPEAVTQPLTLSPDQEQLVQTQTATGLQKWDLEHPAPDQETNPQAYEQWCQDRWQAEQNEVVNAKVGLNMQEWDKQNPQPDPAKEPEKNAQWQNRRVVQEKTIKEKTAKEVKDLKVAELAEVAEKLKRLQALYQERKELENGIKVLRDRKEQSDSDKVDIARFDVRKAEVETQISILEVDLRAKAAKSPLLGAMIYPALILGASAVSVYSIGKEEKVV